MTVDDLIRELSALDPIDRTLPVHPVDCVEVFPGRCVALTDSSARSLRMYPRSRP